MIIILNQAQIEQALSDYIHARIVVQDGMQLDIDLKATRGETGMTATIEINPITDVVEATPVVEAVAPKPVRVARTKPAVEAAAIVTADATESSPAAEEPPFDTEAAPEAPVEDAAPAEPKRSIFANMKKPTGRVGDGDNAEAA